VYYLRISSKESIGARPSGKHAMNSDTLLTRPITRRAKVADVAPATAAFSTLVLPQLLQALAPTRRIALARAAFASGAFCDAMGRRKPLIRAGFVLPPPLALWLGTMSSQAPSCALLLNGLKSPAAASLASSSPSGGGFPLIR
jgi:hypothetical protein